jgi:transcriptional regulator with XRE-family HTH domain
MPLGNVAFCAHCFEMPHPVDVFIGRRIREARVHAGLTQKDLAERVGVAFQQLQKYETARNRVSGSRLWMIANALNIPVPSLLPVSDEEVPEADPLETWNVALMQDILNLEPDVRLKVARFVRSLAGAQSEEAAGE